MNFGLGKGCLWSSALPKYQRRRRSITVTASSGVAETVIWRSCRFIGALFRALQDLLGGLGRFIPGRIGGNHRSAGSYALVGNNAFMG